MKNKICLFSSYSENKKIDNYIKFYLNDLKNYFTTIIFITNNREIEESDVQFLKQNNIELRMVQNRGYDFGMYWHVLKDLDTTQFNTLAFVNDSCYLFKPLKHFFLWAQNQTLDVIGMTDSIFKYHHIQSYFLIFNYRVLSFVKDYFIKHGLIDDVHQLIETYEIGLCRYLTGLGYQIGAMFSQKLLKNNSNIMTEAAVELLSRGIPLIKRKLVHNTFRDDEISYLQHVKFDFSTDYKQLLYNYAKADTLNYILNSHTIKIYQIYYDVEQIKYLSTDILPLYNENLTVYFENDIIKQLYYDNKITDADYFGILSWRFQQKNGFQFKSNTIDGKYDIYCFSNSTRKHDVFLDSTTCHPYFMEIFKTVLENLKIDTNIRPTLGLYMNCVIVKSHIYKKYVEEFLIPTIDFLNNLQSTHPDLYTKLWSDAQYKYDSNLTQRLLTHTNKPYYTYHTFICERLWSVFYYLNVDNYSIKVIDRNEIIATAFVQRSQKINQHWHGSIVENLDTPIRGIVKNVESEKREYAICISHLNDRHNLEKINQENLLYDLYLTSSENLNINRWQNFFKKHKIIAKQFIDDVVSKLSKTTLLNMYLCSTAHQLLIEEEQALKHKYKIVVYSNSLHILSNVIDVHKMKIQMNTLYVKRGAYWFGKSELMCLFADIFNEHKNFQNISIDDVMTQFALRRNIKIIEI